MRSLYKNSRPMPSQNTRVLMINIIHAYIILASQDTSNETGSHAKKLTGVDYLSPQKSPLDKPEEMGMFVVLKLQSSNILLYVHLFRGD